VDKLKSERLEHLTIIAEDEVNIVEQMHFLFSFLQKHQKSHSGHFEN